MDGWTMDREMRQQLSVTVATRFDRETVILLREVARGKGIGATTLIRMWTLERLRHLDKAGRSEDLVDASL